MKTRLVKLLLSLCGAAVMLTGCYKGEIERLQQEVNDLNVRELSAQVESMKASVKDLTAIKEQLAPALDNLVSEKKRLEGELSDLTKKVGDLSTASEDVKAQAEAMSARLATVEAAIEILSNINIDDRLDELKRLAKKLDEGLTQFEVLTENFATIDMVAKLEATVQAIADAFDSKFDAALNRCKNQILGWVFEKDTKDRLFEEYYKKSEIDAKLAIINATNQDQSETIAELQSALKSIESDIQRTITEAVSSAFSEIDEKYTAQLNSIKNRLDGIESVVEAIDAKIGNETIAIEGSIINAINIINARFGNLGGETVEAIITALTTDIDLLKRADVAIRGGAAEGVSLKTLSDKVATLATAESVTELNNTVGQLQEDIKDYLIRDDFDEIIKAYLTTEEAGKTYALAKDLSDFMATYYAIVGDKDDVKAGTVLAQIAELNTIVGNGSFTASWTTDLTSAVNTLYGLVGTTDVETQATTAAQNVINKFIKDILGKDGDAEDVKNLLSGFSSSVESINGKIGNISVIGDADIATAIAGIKTTLEGLSEKGHTHVSDDITDLVAKIQSITGVLENLKTSVKTTLVDAINSLVTELGDYSTKTEVEELIKKMQLVLAAAIMDGDNDYFKTLNLTALQSAVTEIIKTGGTIDSKIDEAIELLKIDQYINEEELMAKGFLTAEDVDPDVVLALKALEVTIGSKTYSYAEMDDAIKAVYDELSQYIDNYNAAKGTFSTLAARFLNIEGMIGTGFSDANTIYSNITNIINLFGDLGAGETVKGLTDNLKELFDNLMIALVGVDGEIDETNNLNALKTKLDNLGFGDLSDEGKTLTEVLAGINEKIDGINGQIGEGYDSEHTLADAIEFLEGALEEITDADYQGQIDESKADLQALIDVLAGKKDAGLADIATDIPTLNGLLDAIKTRIDKVQYGTAQKTLEEVVGDLDARIKVVETVIGDPTKYDIADLSAAVAELQKKIASDDFWISMAEIAAGQIKSQLGIADLDAKIGNVEALATSEKTIVAAINELYAKIGSTTEGSATKDDINNLRTEILGQINAEGITYKTIKALSDQLEILVTYVGEKPGEFDHTSIYGAIVDFDSALEELGLDEKPEGQTTIWAAIKALKDAVDAMGGGEEDPAVKGLLDYLHGISCQSASSEVTRLDGVMGNLEMSFSFNAESDFAPGSYSVVALLNPLKTKASSGTPVRVEVLSSSYSGMTVRIAGSDIASVVGNSYTSFSVALMISSGSASVSSPYVTASVKDERSQKYVINGIRNVCSDMTGSGTSLTAKFANKKTYSFAVDTDCPDFKVAGSGCVSWAAIDGNIVHFELSENNDSRDKSGSIIITTSDKESPATLTVGITQPKKALSYSGSTKYKSNSKLDISVSNNFEAVGGYSVSFQPSGSTIYPISIDSQGKITGTTPRNNWKGGTITVTNDNLTLTIQISAN